MRNKVESYLDPKSLSRVTAFRGSWVSGISICKVGSHTETQGLRYNMGWAASLNAEDRQVSIISTPTRWPSGVIVPRLEVVDAQHSDDSHDNDLEDIKTGLGFEWDTTTLESVSIVRDTVRWRADENDWELVIDKAIRLCFGNGSELLVMSADSHIGLMQFWIGTSAIDIHRDPLLFGVYMFAPRELESIERLEVFL